MTLDVCVLRAPSCMCMSRLGSDMVGQNMEVTREINAER